MLQIADNTLVNANHILYLSAEHDLRLVGLGDTHIVVEDNYYRAVELFLSLNGFVPLNVTSNDGTPLILFVNPYHITCAQVFPDNSSAVTLTDGSTLIVMGNVISMLDLPLFF